MLLLSLRPRDTALCVQHLIVDTGYFLQTALRKKPFCAG